MPVNKSGLQSALEPLFADPPDNREACASLWAAALQTYVVGMIPPHVAASGAASTALEAELLGVFNTWWGNSTAGENLDCGPYEDAFYNFGLAIKDSDAGLYEGVLEPQLPVGLCSLGNADSHADAAAAWASAIDTWFKTGTSKLKATPFTEVTWT